MHTADIDRVIERYIEERKHTPQQVAQEHFLSYTYLVCNRSEVEPFLKRTRSLLTFHIDSLSLFENPFRNSQVCWLMFLPVWFIYSLNLTSDQHMLLGLINCAGTVIFGTSLFVMVMNRWIDTCIKITYYREIIAFIDSQQTSPAGEASA